MSQKISTICVQGGYTPKNGEPRILPIYQSTTYKYDSIEQMGRLFDLSEPGVFLQGSRTRRTTRSRRRYALLRAARRRRRPLPVRRRHSIRCSISAAREIQIVGVLPDRTAEASNLISVTMAKMGIESTFVHPHLPRGAAFRPNTKGCVRRDAR